jgi:hypothetical protein
MLLLASSAWLSGLCGLEWIFKERRARKSPRFKADSNTLRRLPNNDAAVNRLPHPGQPRLRRLQQQARLRQPGTKLRCGPFAIFYSVWARPAILALIAIAVPPAAVTAPRFSTRCGHAQRFSP